MERDSSAEVEAAKRRELKKKEEEVERLSSELAVKEAEKQVLHNEGERGCKYPEEMEDRLDELMADITELATGLVVAKEETMKAEMELEDLKSQGNVTAEIYKWVSLFSQVAINSVYFVLSAWYCLQPDPQKCRAEGYGLQYGQTNEVAQFKVHLLDASGAPCSERQVVSARLTSSVNCSTIEAKVECKSPASYIVSYRASVRGRHELSVEVNGQMIAGSSFRVYIQQPPQLLNMPVREIREVVGPNRAVVNESGCLVVTRFGGLSVFDGEGELVDTFESLPSMLNPTGIVVDGKGNIYISDCNTRIVMKLSSSGVALKSVAGGDSSTGKFGSPDGLALKDDKLFVCDSDKQRVLMFDLNLTFIRQLGITTYQPVDLAFDTEGNMYIVSNGSGCVQVFSPSGTFLRVFGGRGDGPGEVDGKLDEPVGIHVDCSSVYITERWNYRVSVFTTLGKFITSFGGQGSGEGEFSGITMDRDGYLYVCDNSNARVQVF